jgi:hypothetical protein
MKKALALLLVLAFVIWIPGSVVAKKDKDFESQADEQSASQFCDANHNMGYNSKGRCVRVYMACYGPGNTEAVCVCRNYQNESPTAFFTNFNNLNECINFERQGYVFE